MVLEVKNPPANAKDVREAGLIPGSRGTAWFFHLTLSKRILNILQATHSLESQRDFKGIIKVVIILIFLLTEWVRGSIKKPL